MLRAYTMRLKTTRKQSETLERLLAQLCELYNMALQQRRDVWKSHRKSLGIYEQMRQLTELRGGLEEYAAFPATIQRDPLRDYLYWWDVRGAYHQHYLTGGQIVHISDQPLPIKSVIINFEAATEK